MTTTTDRTSAAAAAQSAPRFDYPPIGFFGSVMGLCGLSVAWRLAHEQFGAPIAISEAIGFVAVAAFISLVIAYSAKAILAPDAVQTEFHHPIIGSLFGTVVISVLLLQSSLPP